MKKPSSAQTAKRRLPEGGEGPVVHGGVRPAWRAWGARALPLVLAGGLVCGMFGMSACSSGTSSSGGSGGAESLSAGASSDVQGNIEADTASMNFEYSNRDNDASYESSSATTIALSSGKAKVSGSGAAAKGGRVTIVKEGTYIVSGSSKNAQIVVDADEASKVKIVLNGVEMSCKNGPCIYAKSADKVFLTLVEGAENELSDGTSWTLSGKSGEPNATIYSVCDLTVNGSGALAVDATVHNGISSKDDITITGGSITVDAANNAIRGNDKVQVGGGTLALTAQSDGLKSANDKDDAKGFVSIDGGEVTIEAQDDGIDATNYIRVVDGTLTINAADDALHSDKDLAIMGGTVTVDAGDDALQGKENVWVAGGTVTVNSCKDALKGQNVNAEEGTVTIVSSGEE